MPRGARGFPGEAALPRRLARPRDTGLARVAPSARRGAKPSLQVTIGVHQVGDRRGHSGRRCHRGRCSDSRAFVFEGSSPNLAGHKLNHQEKHLLSHRPHLVQSQVTRHVPGRGGPPAPAFCTAARGRGARRRSAGSSAPSLPYPKPGLCWSCLLEPELCLAFRLWALMKQELVCCAC